MLMAIYFDVIINNKLIVIEVVCHLIKFNFFISLMDYV